MNNAVYIVHNMSHAPKIFAILNITPDSFSDGGKFVDYDSAIAHAEDLVAQGADFIDVGGESTRPGALSISSVEEWGRISRVVMTLLKRFPGKISLDTRHPETAEKFLCAGGSVLNDVSGFQDPVMVQLAVKYKPLVIVNHFPGKTVAEVHELSIDDPVQVRDDLLLRKNELVDAGVLVENIVLDPGIGFGKTVGCNWELLDFPLLVPGERVLVGFSRKRFLGEGRWLVWCRR